MKKTRETKSLTQFGTYGFLTTLMAAQIAMAPRLFADTLENKVDRGGVDTKKSARSVKRDLKKKGREVTGQDNTYDDMKDEVKDAGKNVKDETQYQGRKIERQAE